MGNIASVKKAFQKIGAEVIISNTQQDIEQASHIILPGVGAFGDGIKNLKQLNIIDLLYKKVIQDATPFLGLCLGMQLIATSGHEFGTHHGLGWIKGEVVKLAVDKKLRLPHIGWNDITIKKSNLFDNILDKNFYFVHSFHLVPDQKDIITSTCNYGQAFVATIQQDNIFATQFHPEKSQTSGLQLLKNFLAYA